ncbi:MAG TPA: hypothetical protein VM686_30950, partial [Polyangiaceae bacterium]|nr:hypothetical protein [Polyangiaceae bacterium]
AVPRAQKERPKPLRLGIGAGASVNGGVSPSAALSGAFELTAEWNFESLFSPLASLGAESTLPDEAENAEGAAHFRWSVVRGSFCPLRLRAGRSIALRPCGLFEGGVLEADGSDIEQSTSTTTPWWSVGASARGELAVLDPLAVILEAGGRLHLRRDSFYFGSELAGNTVFDVPAGGAFARLSVQTRW